MSEESTSKIYYSMGEVCAIFDVKPSLIRFWEQKFKVIKPHKNKKGNRLFTPKDLENLKIIYHLVKEKGMTLQGAQNVMVAEKESLKPKGDLLDRLLQMKSLLQELSQSLEDNNPEDLIMGEDNAHKKEKEQEQALPFIQQSLF